MIPNRYLALGKKALSTMKAGFELKMSCQLSGYIPVSPEQKSENFSPGWKNRLGMPSSLLCFALDKTAW